MTKPFGTVFGGDLIVTRVICVCAVSVLITVYFVTDGPMPVVIESMAFALWMLWSLFAFIMGFFGLMQIAILLGFVFQPVKTYKEFFGRGRDADLGALAFMVFLFGPIALLPALWLWVPELVKPIFF